MAYESELETELEGEFETEGEFEGEGFLGAIGNVLGGLLGEGEGESEGESEFEGEFEAEFEREFETEINPIRKIYPDAMMEHLGELAAEAETAHEAAEHFLPLVGMAASKLLPVVAKAVAPMAKKALPSMAKAVTRVAPHLTKGVAKIARTLHHNPQTRYLLRAVPGVARRTVGTIAKQAAKGHPVTPRLAVRTLAHHTKRVLGTPRARANALRQHHALERRLHTRWARGMVRPHPRYGVPHRAGVSRPAGAPGTDVRYGQLVGGRCACSPCPSHGAQASSSPAYCRCCGQVLR